MYIEQKQYTRSLYLAFKGGLKYTYCSEGLVIFLCFRENYKLLLLKCFPDVHEALE